MNKSRTTYLFRCYNDSKSDFDFYEYGFHCAGCGAEYEIKATKAITVDNEITCSKCGKTYSKGQYVHMRGVHSERIAESIYCDGNLVKLKKVYQRVTFFNRKWQSKRYVESIVCNVLTGQTYYICKAGKKQTIANITYWRTMPLHMSIERYEEFLNVLIMELKKRDGDIKIGIQPFKKREGIYDVTASAINRYPMITYEEFENLLFPMQCSRNGVKEAKKIKRFAANFTDELLNKYGIKGLCESIWSDYEELSFSKIKKIELLKKYIKDENVFRKMIKDSFLETESFIKDNRLIQSLINFLKKQTKGKEEQFYEMFYDVWPEIQEIAKGLCVIRKYSGLNDDEIYECMLEHPNEISKGMEMLYSKRWDWTTVFDSSTSMDLLQSTNKGKYEIIFPESPNQMSLYVEEIEETGIFKFFKEMDVFLGNLRIGLMVDVYKRPLYVLLFDDKNILKTCNQLPRMPAYAYLNYLKDWLMHNDIQTELDIPTLINRFESPF